MGTIGNLGIFLFLVGGCLSNFCSVKQAFLRNGIVPDLLSYPPRTSAGVFYPNFAVATQGNVLCPSRLKQSPIVVWCANPTRYYTLILADPDAPSRAAPAERAFLHWLVINIPGADLLSGETVFDYVPPGPPPKTGFHRYVFLVYEQQSQICYNGPRESENRPKFSPNMFAALYGLGCPYAGNFFLAQNAIQN